MNARHIVLATVVVAALSALPAAALGSTRATASCSAGAGTWTARSASYRFVLRLGMPETMYTPAQVKKTHPNSGEVMIGGAMGTGGMTMGSNKATRHLEVQICSRKTGAVITNAKPAITLKDSMGMATRVPVAMMRGVDAGMDDMHYGNNVTMPSGQKLTVKVILKGETGIFHVQLAMHM